MNTKYDVGEQIWRVKKTYVKIGKEDLFAFRNGEYVKVKEQGIYDYRWLLDEMKIDSIAINQDIIEYECITKGFAFCTYSESQINNGDVFDSYDLALEYYTKKCVEEGSIG